MRLAVRLATLCAAFASVGLCIATESIANSLILGTSNELLSNGASALEQGDAVNGIRLTLAGLKVSTDARDMAAGHANLCAGYAMQQRWQEAIFECNVSLEMDDTNWRTFNNRASILVATGSYDKAIADILTALKIAPTSSTLQKSLEIAYAHKRAHRDRSRKATIA